MQPNELQLGDIIQIIATDSQELHNSTFYIHYYDPNDMMEIVHVSSLRMYTIPLKRGKIQQYPIQKIVLLNRSLHKGFARQNGLLPNKWVDLEFSGEIRSVIVAQITSLEEDMIELTTFPERDVLYIDFAYKGIPKNIPLKHICFCSKPASYESVVAEKSPQEYEKEKEQDRPDPEEVSTEYNEEGELIVETPENVALEENYKTKLHEEYVANSKESLEIIETHEYEGEIENVFYGLDAQMNFLLDDFLSMIPDEKRNRDTMRNIYIHLNRFKELRELYSTRDEYDQINGFISHDPKKYKPLAKNLYEMSHVPKWIVPVLNVKQRLYLDDAEKAPESYNDVAIMELSSDLQEEQRIEKQMFYGNTLPSDQNKYKQLYETLGREFYTPHSILTDVILEPIARDLKIFEDIDTCIGSNQSLQSISVIQQTDDPVFSRTPFKIRRIEGPIYHSHFMSKGSNERQILMDGESAHLQSLLFLPETFVNRTKLLDGSILDKTKYSSPYLFHLLKHSDKMRHEVDLQNTDSSVRPYETAIADVRVKPVENPIHSLTLKYPTYQAFLQAALPNIYSLIEYYYPQNAQAYNLHDYLYTFGPYRLFQDNVTFSAMQSVKRHITQNISNYEKDLSEKRENYVNYALAKYPHNSQPTSELYLPFMDKYFLENVADRKQFQELFSDSASSQLFLDVNNVNNAQLFFAWILWSNLSLISPVNMFEPILDQSSLLNKTKQNTLAKKYTSLHELQQDNDKRDLKFDEEYDANQYDFLDKYRREMSGKPPEEFLHFLEDKLASEYGCLIDQVHDLAEQLMQGYKLVQDGDYALLETKPHLPPGVEECDFTEKEKNSILIEANVRKVEKYFKRVEHVWVYDADASTDSFTNPKELANALQTKHLKNAQNQEIVKNKYGETMERIEEEIRNLIQKQQQDLQNTRRLQKEKRFEKDKYFQKLGNMAYISETIPSPNQELLNEIMHKSIGFEEKQKNLIEFCNIYCRDALQTEDPNWKYCVSSMQSLPMVPLVLYDLAVAFQRNEYIPAFSRMIKDKQIRFEDGRYIVSHGGFILDEVEFSSQGMELMEDIDEQDTWNSNEAVTNTSFKVDTHRQKKIYTDRKLRIIYNMISAMCRNIYIPMDRIEETAMSLCMEFVSMKSIFMGQKKYEYVMNLRYKDKKYQSYELYEASQLVDMTVCCLIVAIQCTVPSFESRKTIGKCVKILDGYPLNEDSGHEGTIEYMACILRKMHSDRKTLPWNTISKASGNMETRLKKMFDICLKNTIVIDLLHTKRVYLKTIDTNIPTEVDVDTHWKHFLPPLKPVVIVNAKVPLRDIETSAHEALKKTLRSGSHDQWNYLGMCFSKTLLFSLGSMEIINGIIKEKGSLLGKYGKQPWLENACCNENTTTQNPYAYFALEDQRLLEYAKSAQKIGSLLDKTRAYIQPPFLHMSETTTSSTHLIGLHINLHNPCSYSDEIIHRTFIHYCHLDSRTKPIPSHFGSFITEKLSEYDPKSSIEEKIQFLKNHEKGLNINSFRSLLNIANRSNEVIPSTRVQVSYHDTVMDTLETMKELMSEDKLIELNEAFKGYMNRDQDGPLEEEESESKKEPELVTIEEKKEEMLTKLEDYLENQTKAMMEKMIDFMQGIGIEKNIITRLLNQFSFSPEETQDYTKFGSFVKNYSYYLCILLPSYLFKGVKHDSIHTKTILMPQDIIDVNKTMENKYLHVDAFVQDEILTPYLKNATSELKSLYAFLGKYHGFFPSSKHTLYLRFFRFSLVFVFYYLIVRTEKQDVLEMIFQHIRTQEEKEEDETILSSNDPDDVVEEIELRAADKGSVQTRVFKFVRALLETKGAYHQDKSYLLQTYNDIRDNVDYFEDEEKTNMMNRFAQNKEHKTRRAEKELKKHRLGQYFVNQKVINTYGKKRDNMLQTKDMNEEDLIFRKKSTANNFSDMFENEEEYAEMVQELLEDSLKENDEDAILGENEDSDTEDLGESEEDMNRFLRKYEDEDYYDIAENRADS